VSNKINAVLGLKPSTRKRIATHSKHLVTETPCPSCGAYRVRETIIKQIAERACDLCGYRWRPNGEPPYAYVDGVGKLRCDGCLRTLPEHTEDCKFRPTAEA